MGNKSQQLHDEFFEAAAVNSDYCWRLKDIATLSNTAS